MRGNYTVNSGVRFRMLTDDQLEELYNGVLHVLEYTGLDVHHDQAREILKEKRGLGRWFASTHSILSRQKIPRISATQLHHICPRWKSRA